MPTKSLQKLLESLKMHALFAEIHISKDVLVSGVTADSRRCQQGFIFVAKSGADVGSKDGHEFIEQAIKNGAQIIVVNKDYQIPSNLAVVVLKSHDTKLALSHLCEAFFDFPSKKLKVIGITGTNGKTSTCFMVHSILKSAGFCPKIMGTLGIGDPNDLQKQSHTTMEAEFISEALHNFLKIGATHVIMEVSSHALTLARVEAITFHAVALTNITQDHLDFHGTLKAYAQAKMRLFTELAQPETISVLPNPNPFERNFPHLNLVFFGATPNSHCHFSNIANKFNKTYFTLFIDEIPLEIELPFLGHFHLLNASLSAMLAFRLGAKFNAIQKGLKECPAIPGRFESVNMSSSPQVFVDFAHTPHALRLLLTSARTFSRKKIILVFGCGGNRDREKRAQMGKIAQELADFIIITDDNPRDENPHAIRQEILHAIGKSDKFIEIGDRKKAIEHAIKYANKSDIVLIAGKGHETYQIYGDEKRPFSDKNVAKEALETVCH